MRVVWLVLLASIASCSVILGIDVLESGETVDAGADAGDAASPD